MTIAALLDSKEVHYLILIVGLFLAPKILQRARLPSALSCVAIGAIAGMGLHAFHDDTTIPTFATLGIVALFLFAGLEVDLDDLRKGARVLLQHLAIQLVILAVTAAGVGAVFGLTWRPALLFALALVTPSTGFILDSLGGFGLNTHEQFWVRSKAIATELVALAALFVTVQSKSATTLAASGAVMVAMVLILPWVFQFFAKIIVPFAPKTEFTFLLMMALVCAFITRNLGAYYLVGAFVVGLAAVRMRNSLPSLTSHRLIDAMGLFAGFFTPFYFFKAGLHLAPENFTPRALAVGVGLAAIFVPLKIGVVVLHRWRAVDEPIKSSARVGLAITPTLVFTLVLAAILGDQYGLDAELFGALMVFTFISTIIPGFVLRASTVQYTRTDIDDWLHPPAGVVAAAGDAPPKSPAA